MLKRVLIVDDNEQSRILMRKILKALQCDVIEAENGEQGTRLAKEQKPDLVLMDIQMPVMDGYTAIRMLKDDPETRHIKIIAVTSYAMKGDREKALLAGADDYIAKPVDMYEMMEMVKRHLGI